MMQNNKNRLLKEYNDWNKIVYFEKYEIIFFFLIFFFINTNKIKF